MRSADEARLMPHLHLSLQSGDDLILKRMKRRHLRADAIAFCETVRRLRPDTVFGADLIAGFPTETEAMFAALARSRRANAGSRTCMFFRSRRGRARRRRGCRSCRAPSSKSAHGGCANAARSRYAGISMPKSARRGAS